MCFGGSPKYTAPEPVVIPQAPKPVDTAVQTARSDERRRAATMGGIAGTVATGTRGILSEASTTLNNQKKSLLAG